ncbi:metal binding domain of Ada-domain-containing protein [Hypoxylon argillaceum]|nr:metal binding domain of Ada-domain-containing protein [Hypoxylon argillaceum]KAI1145195.1 metal binding domain of Ada-domain-containing protein [Nemania diffusa]
MVQSAAVAIPRDKRVKSALSTTASTPTDEARWRLVLAHTPTLDFLYGVISTGIFCRTSCPSRRPRRANVRFFDSAASAVAAGFRACRRCRPESKDSSHESPQASAEKQVEIACEYIRQRKGEAQLLDIAAHVGLSPRYFHGLFKQVMGTTPGAYAVAVRREGMGVPMTPVATVPNSTLGDFDFSKFIEMSDLAPLENGACGMSSANPSHATHDWLLGTLGNPSYISFDETPYSDWINDCSFDMTGFLGTNNDPIELQTHVSLQDCVDPSLISSSRAPS